MVEHDNLKGIDRKTDTDTDVVENVNKNIIDKKNDTDVVEDVNKKVADGEIDADYGYINNKITNNESCRNNK